MVATAKGFGSHHITLVQPPAILGIHQRTASILANTLQFKRAARRKMTFPQPEQYFGLLIGSVDAGNTLSFYVYNGSVLVGSISGSQFQLWHARRYRPRHSVYLNVTSSVPFTTVVATYNGASLNLTTWLTLPKLGNPHEYRLRQFRNRPRQEG